MQLVFQQQKEPDRTSKVPPEGSRDVHVYRLLEIISSEAHAARSPEDPRETERAIDEARVRYLRAILRE